MPTILPLLHASQPIRPATPDFLDCLIVLGIAFALGAAAAVVTRFQYRARRRLVVAAVSALAAVSLAWSIAPADHLLRTVAADGGTAAVHQAHCHGAPGTCAGGSSGGGSANWIAQAPTVIAMPPMLFIAVALFTPVLWSVTRRPLLRPPLLSVATSI